MSQNGINVASFARKYETSWMIFTQCEHVLKHVRTCLSIVLKPCLETKFVKTISFQECATFLEAWNSYILTPFFTEALNQNWNLSITFMTSLGSDFQTLFAVQVANFTRVDVLKAETWNLSGRLEGQTTQIWTFAKLPIFCWLQLVLHQWRQKSFMGKRMHWHLTQY